MLTSRWHARFAQSFLRFFGFLRFLVHLHAHFDEERIDRLVYQVAVEVFRADDALFIKDVDGWPSLYVPGGSDGAVGAATIPKGTPGDVFLFQDLFDIVAVPIRVDADDCKRFPFEPFYE